jgi:pyruvate, water dikinase
MDLKHLVKNLHQGESAAGIKSKKNILWFDELCIDDIPLVGGKNASLGEMYSELTKLGVKIPYGFAVTAYAYNTFIEESGIRDKISEILSDLDTSNLINLQERGKKVRTTILDASFPELLKLQIIKAYKDMEQNTASM